MTEPANTWHAWTSREVHFEPFPTCRFDLESVLDRLCDHYWSRPALIHRCMEPTIGVAGDGGFLVGGLPWWLPTWWALRSVTAVMVDADVEGTAHCRTVRTALTMPTSE